MFHGALSTDKAICTVETFCAKKLLFLTDENYGENLHHKPVHFET